MSCNGGPEHQLTGPDRISSVLLWILCFWLQMVQLAYIIQEGLINFLFMLYTRIKEELFVCAENFDKICNQK